MLNFYNNLFLFLSDPRAGILCGKYYRELMVTQWLNREKIENIQKDKLTKLINYASKNVPFYKKYQKFEKNQTSLRNIIKKYPIITKHNLRNKSNLFHPKEFNLGKRMVTKTGGTTGNPIEIIYNKQRRAVVTSAYWRGKSWVNINPRTRGVFLRSTKSCPWYAKLRIKILNRINLKVHDSKHQEQNQNYSYLKKLNPKYIEGYVSDIFETLESWQKAEVTFDYVFTTGEMLYDTQKSKLRKIFKAEVKQYYGCNEIGSMAYECEYGNLHVTEEHVILEVVDEAGNPVFDKPGRIILTDLDNYYTPLIRYEIGDVGTITNEKCKCGRSLMILKDIQGRTQDYLTNKFGKKISNIMIAGKFKDLVDIEEIQVVQNSLSKITLYYVTEKKNVNKELEAIDSYVKSILGEDIKLIKKKVDNIPTTSRGKKRLIIGLNG